MNWVSIVHHWFCIRSCLHPPACDCSTLIPMQCWTGHWPLIVVIAADCARPTTQPTHATVWRDYAKVAAVHLDALNESIIKRYTLFAFLHGFFFFCNCWHSFAFLIELHNFAAISSALIRRLRLCAAPSCAHCNSIINRCTWYVSVVIYSCTSIYLLSIVIIAFTYFVEFEESCKRLLSIAAACI